MKRFKVTWTHKEFGILAVEMYEKDMQDCEISLKSMYKEKFVSIISIDELFVC